MKAEKSAAYNTWVVRARRRAKILRQLACRPRFAPFGHEKLPVRLHRSATIFAGLFAAACCLPAPAGAQSLGELRAARQANFEPRALLLLRQMTEAYTQITFLDQKTVFYSLQTPLLKEGTEEKNSIHNPQSTIHNSNALPHVPVEKPLGRTVHLMVAGPNRLHLDITEAGNVGEPEKTATTICDGKMLFVYNPAKNWYTQEKAPRSFRDFQKVTSLDNTTLELLLLTGMDPFSDLENQFDAVKYEGTQIARGVETDVVALRTVSEQQTQELRFYIGREDGLLRRLVVETVPILRQVAPSTHDPLDDLVARPPAQPPTENPPGFMPEVAPGFEDPHPIAPPGAPMRTRITCENSFTLSPVFEPDTFQFKPPKNAALYQGINGNGDFNKMSNTLNMQDLLRKARTAKKGKKSKPVRLTP